MRGVTLRALQPWLHLDIGSVEMQRRCTVGAAHVVLHRHARLAVPVLDNECCHGPGVAAGSVGSTTLPTLIGQDITPTSPHVDERVSTAPG